jgi:hypothetical protein
VRLILCAFALVASACAHQPHAPRMTHAPLPPLQVSVSVDRLQAICCALDHGCRYRMYSGCAERDYANNVCVVWTEPNPPAWVLSDEYEHCAGGSHPL